jgi:hypothetical protein
MYSYFSKGQRFLFVRVHLKLLLGEPLFRGDPHSDNYVTAFAYISKF